MTIEIIKEERHDGVPLLSSLQSGIVKFIAGR